MSGFPSVASIMASGKDRWYQFGLGAQFVFVAGLSCFFAVWVQLSLYCALGATILCGMALMLIGARTADDRLARRRRLWGTWLALYAVFLLFAILSWKRAAPTDNKAWLVVVALFGNPLLPMSLRLFGKLPPRIMLYNHSGQIIESVRFSVGEEGDTPRLLTFDRLRPYARRCLHPAHLHTQWGISYNLNGTRHDYSQEIALETADRYLIEIMPDGSIKPRFNRWEDCLRR